MSEEFIKNPKLAKFFKNDTAASKRVKNLVQFLAAVPPAEQSRFHREHVKDVYNVVLDTLAQFDFEFKKGQSVSPDDVREALVLLGTMIDENAEQIQKRWQMRSLGQLVSRLLNYGNRSEVRELGLNLLLRLLDILEGQADSLLLDMLAEAVDFTPFCDSPSTNASHSKIRAWYLSDKNGLGTVSADQFSFALTGMQPVTITIGPTGTVSSVPSPVASTPGVPLSVSTAAPAGSTVLQRRPPSSSGFESLRMLDNILNFIAADVRRKRFPFWFDLLKNRILPTLYPAVCTVLRLGVTQASEQAVGSALPPVGMVLNNPGFRPECPPEIQAVMVQWLTRCVRVPELCNVLLGDELNTKLVLEIFRQTFTMPVSSADTYGQVLECYITWTRGEAVTPFVFSYIQSILQTVIEQMFPTLYWETSAPVLSSSSSGPAGSAGNAGGSSGGGGAGAAGGSAGGGGAGSGGGNANSGGGSGSVQYDMRKINMRMKICGQVLNVYRLMATEPWVQLTELTWERLLVTLLNAANYLIKTSEFQARPFTDANFEDKLVVPLLECLFQCYLQSSTRTPLWDVLQDKVSSWIHCKPAVATWKRRLVTLTVELLNILAEDAHASKTAPSHTRPRNRKVSTGTPGDHHTEVPAHHRSVSSPQPPVTSGGAAASSSLTLVQEMDTQAFLRHTGIDSEETRLERFNEAFRVWRHFLGVLGNPNMIETPAIREIALQGLVGSLNILIDAIVKSPVKTAKAKLAAQAASAALRGDGAAATVTSSSSMDDLSSAAGAHHSDPSSDGTLGSGGVPAIALAERRYLPQGDTLLKVFGPWLFDCCMSSENDAHSVAARVLAYGALCRIFSTRCSQAYDHVFLCSFYQLLHQALENSQQDAARAEMGFGAATSAIPIPSSMKLEDVPAAAPGGREFSLIKNPVSFLWSAFRAINREIEWTVLRSCTQLFGVGLPGVNILIPAFMRSIARVLSADGVATTSVPLRKAAVAILHSWLYYPTYFGPAPIPDISQIYDDSAAETDPTGPHRTWGSYADVRRQILAVLLRSLQVEVDGATRSAVIWGLYFVLCEECSKLKAPAAAVSEANKAALTAPPDLAAVREIIDALLLVIVPTATDVLVPHTAFEALRALVLFADPLSSIQHAAVPASHAYASIDVLRDGPSSGASAATVNSVIPSGSEGKPSDNLLSVVLGGLSQYIVKQIQLINSTPRDKLTTVRGELVAEGLYCLLEWLMVVPTSVLSPPSTPANPFTRERERLSSVIFTALQSSVTCFYEMAHRPSIVAALSPMASGASGAGSSEGGSAAPPQIHPALVAQAQQQTAAPSSTSASISIRNFFAKAAGVMPSHKPNQPSTASGAISGGGNSGSSANTNAGASTSAASSSTGGSSSGAGGAAGDKAGQSGESAPPHLIASQAVQEAADSVLRHLFARLNHFPMRGTRSVENLMTSVTEENDLIPSLGLGPPLSSAAGAQLKEVPSGPQLHFIFEHGVLISATERPDPDAAALAALSAQQKLAGAPLIQHAMPTLPPAVSFAPTSTPTASGQELKAGPLQRVSVSTGPPAGGTCVRLILRDKTGKYVWDLHPTPAAPILAWVRAAKEKQMEQKDKSDQSQADSVTTASSSGAAGGGTAMAGLISPRSTTPVDGLVSPRSPSPNPISRQGSGDAFSSTHALSDAPAPKGTDVSSLALMDALDHDAPDGTVTSDTAPSDHHADPHVDRTASDDSLASAAAAAADAGLHTDHDTDLAVAAASASSAGAGANASGRAAGPPPEFTPEQDMLSQILTYIDSNFPDDAVIDKNWKRKIPSELQKELDAVALQMLAQSHQESALYKRCLARVYELNQQALGTKSQPSNAAKPMGREPVTSVDLCRFLLSQLFIGLDLHKVAASMRDPAGHHMTVLEDNAKLRRSLKLLDGTPSRECHKIGIIYVGSGQDAQNDILGNTTGNTTPAYRRFLAELGDLVDIATHNGFLGGLDHRSTGPQSVYYATSTVELMFHVVTLMPTHPSDPQQIHKKRQVGNDHVHIVWSDHERDYRPATISSQFNDAHVCIYPLSNRPGLFRIQVFTKPDKVPPFGPLQDGMVVPEFLLAPLVRTTALNANRARRYATQGYGRPYPTRQKYIGEIIERHAKRLPMHQFLASFYQNQAPPVASAAAGGDHVERGPE